MQQMYSRETELRHLHPNDIYKLGEILDANDCWKKLMEIIPKELNAQETSLDGQLDWEKAAAKGLKYTNDHIRLIENAVKRAGELRLCGQILLDEWSTSGKKHERPTVGVLQQLLVQAELYRAADAVARDFLRESPPARPTNGPAAKVDISLTDELFEDIRDRVNDSTFYPDTEALNDNANYGNSITDNNKDFYTKYHRIDKALATNESAAPKPPPRMNRYARSEKQRNLPRTQSNATTITVPSLPNDEQQAEVPTLTTLSQNIDVSEQNLPRLSALMTNGSEKISNSMTSDDSNINEYPNTQSTNLSDAPIPLISLLSQRSIKSTDDAPDEYASNSITENEMLPVISALNLNGERSVEQRNAESRNSGISERSNSSSLSEDSESDDCPLPDIAENNEQDEDEFTPNMEHRDSNNDSSLTSVTGTSGDNSFDLSMNDCSLASNDNENIPCLSALKQ